MKTQRIGKCRASLSRELVSSRQSNGAKKHPQRGALVYPLGFEPKLDGVGGRNVIQLHYEYVFFFKKHIYFTIFRFLFASVYGIILPNSKKNFFQVLIFGQSAKKGARINVENGRNRYEWGRG